MSAARKGGRGGVPSWCYVRTQQVLIIILHRFLVHDLHIIITFCGQNFFPSGGGVRRIILFTKVLSLFSVTLIWKFILFEFSGSRGGSGFGTNKDPLMINMDNYKVKVILNSFWAWRLNYFFCDIEI